MARTCAWLCAAAQGETPALADLDEVFETYAQAERLFGATFSAYGMRRV